MKTKLEWLDSSQYLPEDNEVVLLAWKRRRGDIFRTGVHNGRKWLLTDGTTPAQEPAYFSELPKRIP